MGLKRTIKFTGKSNGSIGIEKELEGGNLSNTPIHCMHVWSSQTVKIFIKRRLLAGPAEACSIIGEDCGVFKDTMKD